MPLLFLTPYQRKLEQAIRANDLKKVRSLVEKEPPHLKWRMHRVRLGAWWQKFHPDRLTRTSILYHCVQENRAEVITLLAELGLSPGNSDPYLRVYPTGDKDNPTIIGNAQIAALHYHKLEATLALIKMRAANPYYTPIEARTKEGGALGMASYLSCLIDWHADTGGPTFVAQLLGTLLEGDALSQNWAVTQLKEMPHFGTKRSLDTVPLLKHHAQVETLLQDRTSEHAQAFLVRLAKDRIRQWMQQQKRQPNLDKDSSKLQRFLSL